MERCGSAPAAQWFKRTTGGEGEGLYVTHASNDFVGRILSREEFPSLLIQRSWQDVGHNKLIECYLQWLAPALLHLQDFTADKRDWLEASACAQALELNRHATVYPEVIERERMNSALVQARMRIANNYELN